MGFIKLILVFATLIYSWRIIAKARKKVSPAKTKLNILV